MYTVQYWCVSKICESFIRCIVSLCLVQFVAYMFSFTALFCNLNKFMQTCSFQECLTVMQIKMATLNWRYNSCVKTDRERKKERDRQTDRQGNIDRQKNRLTEEETDRQYVQCKIVFQLSHVEKAQTLVVEMLKTLQGMSLISVTCI